MSRPPLRVAIVGAGLMGRWHAAAASRAGGRVVTVADLDSRRAASLARPYGARATETGAVLDGRDLDAVHVCTPLDTHADIVGELLRAGLPVLVEKPLARDPAETEVLLRAAQISRVALCPVHQFPFQRGAARVLRAPERLGTIRHVDYVACSAGGVGRDPQVLAGIVADILPHPLSLLRGVLPDSLESLPWQVIRTTAGELRASTGCGPTSVGILVSMTGRPTRNTLRLVGTGGTAHLDLFHGFATVEPAGVSRLRKVARPFSHAGATVVAAAANLGGRLARRESAYPGLRELIEAFYRAVRREADAPIGPDEILDIARTRALLIGTSG